MASIPSRSLRPKELFPHQNFKEQRKNYIVSIVNKNLDFTDDEHEKFIKENIYFFKELSQSFIKDAFFSAVKKGHIKTLKVILQKKCIDINIQDEFYNTVLIMASELGYFEIVNYLIQQKDDKDAQNEYGDTALIIAARKGSKYIVKFLCDNGANEDIRNKNGQTALTQLSITKKTIEIVDILTRKKGMETLLYDIETISSIAKYANKLIKKLSGLEEKKKTRSNNSNALVLFPISDQNGAFTIHQRLYIIRTLRKYYNKIKVKHPISAEQLISLFEKKEYNLFFISGHGSSKDIILSESFSLTEKNIIQIFTSIKKSQNVEIVLNSCSTGKNGGIAELIARQAGIETIAPEEDFDGFTIQLRDGLQIDFSFGGRKVSTRVINPNAENVVESNDEEKNSSRPKKRKRNSSFK